MDSETRIKITGQDVLKSSISDECAYPVETSFEVVKHGGADNISFIFDDTEISVPKTEIENIFRFLISSSIECLPVQYPKIEVEEHIQCADTEKIFIPTGNFPKY